MATLPKPFSCVVHYYSVEPLLNAYELPAPNARNAVIFIGGLFDGPNTVDYVRTVSEHLIAHSTPWSIFDARISSSFTGFGHGSLARDVEEISRLVTYLRHLGKEKVVLMGHSTGSQDCIHYALNAASSVPVDGYILQGPASDREALKLELSEEEHSKPLKAATDLISQGKGLELLPRFTGNLVYFPPMTAYRWHSLQGVGGDDDYFSSDLSDERLKETFGRLTKPTLILESAQDQFIDPSIDKAALVERWSSISTNGAISDLSGLIPGADHQVHQHDAQVWLAECVEKFLGQL